MTFYKDLDEVKIDGINIKISDDDMKAYICLNPSSGKLQYSKEKIMEAMMLNGIVYGIIDEEIDKIIKEHKYFHEILIAKGYNAENGENGRFEFLFNRDLKRKPKVLADGSVDYKSIENYEVVQANTCVVKYIPATQGHEGKTIRGQILPCKPGKDLQPLKGKGFKLSDDKTQYIAAVDGKIEYVDKKLIISNILEITGDVDLGTGDIDFLGDVHVSGNVFDGMKINTKGNLIVDGYVESAYLSAGKDIILKNGMQGRGKGHVKAGGSISGKFFEHTIVEAKNDVNANAIMNCNIKAGRDIIVVGKFGVIVGGVVSAIRNINATIVGNMSEVKTDIILGVEPNLISELKILEQDMIKAIDDIKNIEQYISKIDMAIEKAPNEKLSQTKMQLLRTKIKIGSDNNIRIARSNEIRDLMTLSSNSQLVVQKNLFPGTKISINGLNYNVKVKQFNCTVKIHNGELKSLPNF